MTLNSTRKIGRYDCWGFTLVEILLVVLVLSIIVGLTIPNFSPTYKKLQLKKTAQDLSYLMRYAQSRAIIKNMDTRIEFDPNYSSYWLTQKKLNSDEPAGNSIYERYTGRWGRMFKIPSDIKIETEDNIIEFHPDGSIEKQQIKLCQERQCFIVSTQEQRAAVHVYESSSN